MYKTTINPKKEKIKDYKILLIEDDIIQYELISLMLKNNIEVIISEREEETLDILKREKIGLIITDILLNGENGLEIVSKIKENNNFNKIPIMFLTSVENDKEELIELYENIKKFAGYGFNK